MIRVKSKIAILIGIIIVAAIFIFIMGTIFGGATSFIRIAISAAIFIHIMNFLTPFINGIIHTAAFIGIGCIWAIRAAIVICCSSSAISISIRISHAIFIGIVIEHV